MYDRVLSGEQLSKLNFQEGTAFVWEGGYTNQDGTL